MQDLKNGGCVFEYLLYDGVLSHVVAASALRSPKLPDVKILPVDLAEPPVPRLLSEHAREVA
jgi:hypothetical protein